VTLHGQHERRPDIVLYLNGIAIGVLELKNSRVSLGDGIRQSLSNQRPEFNAWFFSTVQLIFAGNDSEGHLTDPAYYERMSSLLDEIIRLRKEKAIEYEQYLQRIADLVNRVQSGVAPDAPLQLDTPGRLALYNNLKDRVTLGSAEQVRAAYADKDGKLDLALRLDEAIKNRRPADWRGVVAREQIVKQTMYEVLRDIDEVNRLFPIVFTQKEY
jgi:type I restriction enzyme R subunit